MTVWRIGIDKLGGSNGIEASHQYQPRRKIFYSHNLNGSPSVKNWGRLLGNKCLHEKFERHLQQHRLSVRRPCIRLPMTLRHKQKGPSMMYSTKNLDAGMTWRRVFRRISIFLGAS